MQQLQQWHQNVCFPTAIDYWKLYQPFQLKHAYHRRSCSEKTCDLFQLMTSLSQSCTMDGKTSAQYSSNRSLKFFRAVWWSDIVFLILATTLSLFFSPDTRLRSLMICLNVWRVTSADPVNISHKPSEYTLFCSRHLIRSKVLPKLGSSITV